MRNGLSVLSAARCLVSILYYFRYSDKPKPSVKLFSDRHFIQEACLKKCSGGSLSSVTLIIQRPFAAAGNREIQEHKAEQSRRFTAI